ncbi:MAG: sigma-70 family RNA polymerase sigma factor [Candidatus Hydrogenedentota bacterium]
MNKPLQQSRPSQVRMSESKEGRASNLAKQDDTVLVEEAQKGDVHAFEELVRRYRNEVFGLAYHFLRSREEAWDISQEVFIKAHRALSRFRGDSAFKTWLLRITANQCKDYLKKRRVNTVAFDDAREAADAPSAGLTPAEAAGTAELGAAIEKALEALPVKHRTVFVLREYEGMSYEEMANVIGCSMGTVMSRLHHARKKMRSHLVQMGVVEGQ